MTCRSCGSALFAPERARDRGHLDGGRTARDGEPPLPGDRSVRTRRAHVRSDGRVGVPGRADNPDSTAGPVLAADRRGGGRHRAGRVRRPPGPRHREDAAARAGQPLAANPLFHFDLAAADAELRAARALLYETAEQIWAGRRERSPASRCEQRARVRAAAVWATERRRRRGRGRAPRRRQQLASTHSPLQRRLRDVHTLTQHFLVKRDVLRTAGAVLAGQELDTPVF